MQSTKSTAGKSPLSIVWQSKRKVRGWKRRGVETGMELLHIAASLPAAPHEREPQAHVPWNAETYLPRVKRGGMIPDQRPAPLTDVSCRPHQKRSALFRTHDLGTCDTKLGFVLLPALSRRSNRVAHKGTRLHGQQR